MRKNYCKKLFNKQLSSSITERLNGAAFSKNSPKLAAPFLKAYSGMATTAILAQLNGGNKVVLTYTCNRVAPTT